MSSWVSYLPDHPFPIQNLPFGVFSTADNATKRCATALGDYVVDLSALARLGLLTDPAVAAALSKETMNDFMGLSYDQWAATRAELTSILTTKDASLQEKVKQNALVPAKNAQMHLPAKIGDYTDCYASREHATNLGKMFRPTAAPLLENWLHIPVGYHGRASSIIVSGTPVRRPNGQMQPVPGEPPVFGPCKLVDFELEMAAYIGTSTQLGDVIPVEETRKKVFGFSLFNDWSARDIQKWEYVPLGPFLGKSWASTISPWIVTTFALEPFRVAGPVQGGGEDPKPLPYLQDATPGAYDIHLSATVDLETGESLQITQTNYKYMYWSVFQQLAHHTVNGCNFNPGDVIASGTISGPTPGSYGSLLELTWQGKEPLKFPKGSERKMLQNGDVLSLHGECRGDGYRIGFGECSAKVLPAHELTFKQ